MISRASPPANAEELVTARLSLPDDNTGGARLMAVGGKRRMMKAIVTDSIEAAVGLLERPLDRSSYFAEPL